MLSYLRRTFNPKDVRQVVDMLDQEKNGTEWTKARDYIVTYEGLKDRHYGNSYLTHSIVWGKENAAIDLLTHSQRQGLNYKDQFASSHSTALILCAKTGMNKVAMLLIGLGAKIDEVDYRGFSALHYACLYRNEPLICALLGAGAATNIKNKFGKLPKDYYEMNISFSDLEYNYGVTADSSLVYCCDWDDRFQGTKNSNLSAVRWFIPNIIVNFKLGTNKISAIESDTNKQTSIFILWSEKVTLSSFQKNWTTLQFAKNQLEHRKPVTDSRLYNAMMNSFCDYRKTIALNPQILYFLDPCIEEDRHSLIVPQDRFPTL
jgi:hypothetical protein